MVIRLLGASAPKTLDGRIAGADANAHIAAEFLMNCRRVILSVRLILCCLNCSVPAILSLIIIDQVHGFRKAIIPNRHELGKVNFLAFEMYLPYALRKAQNGAETPSKEKDR
jgi:hypothetical protein